jgi:hypothetical protein
MLSKKTLKLAIETVGLAAYKHANIPHDPLFHDLTEAYSELKKELRELEGHEVCSIIVETETRNMSE